MSTQPLARETPKGAANPAVSRPKNLWMLLTVAIVILMVLIAYIWFVSVGTWTVWPQPYDYSHYDKLSSAFLHGHFFLEAKPDPALLALANPYDPGSRGEIPYLIDASLYGGKYYLYFGPVPAVLLMIAKVFISTVIGDIYLVFGFTCAVFLIEVIFILGIRRRFFPSVPSWLAGACILFLGLGTPFGWILVSQAAVHNASIAAGQFFFLAGLYFAFEALAQEPINRKKAVLAGVLWSAAFGSRITQSVPIAFVVLLILLTVVRRQVGSRRVLKCIWDALSFTAPMILGAAVLGWYNWARFGSVYETGLSYQLAMLPIQRYSQDLFSFRYVLQNLYNYLLNPPKLRYAFPYFWPQIGIRQSILPGLTFPALYFTEENTGLFYVAPFIACSLVYVVAFWSRRTKSAITKIDNPLFLWLVAALGGSFLCGFSVFLGFFWASNRYLMDFLPPVLLLSVMGFWQISGSLSPRSLGRAAIIVVGLGLIAASIIISILLTIGQNAGFFTLLDPHLLKQLNHLFRP